MAEVVEDVDVIEQDEPQFKVEPKTDRKPAKAKSGNVKGTVILLGAVAIAVSAMLFFDDIMAIGNKQPSVKNPSSISMVESGAQLSVETDVSGGNLPVITAEQPDDFFVSSPEAEPFDSTMPLGQSTKAASSAGNDVSQVVGNAQGLNLVLANRLKELSVMVESLAGQVGTLNGQLMTVQRELGQQTLNVQRTLDNVAATLDVARKGDENRDVLITRVLADVRGFQKDLGAERQRFTFKILHDEFYGGRARLVGYEESSPQSILKVYVGGDVGLWRLVAIVDGEAIFKHVDGNEYREKLR
jgi:hypothetical protein